ncbi:vWA domain-containing protein [Nevskia sp.]|uniref:vWA domain-containing protein n=1 Tax=Nevskia sp. TaxID=1929292 RepID=UPI0026000397|nr:vWA domain-containing protein [Nevskia sp.]
MIDGAPSLPLDFAQPWALLLLPLALLPLLRRRREELTFSSLPWLPEDSLGRWIERLGRAAAVLAILATVLALARPGRPEWEVERIGRGAEIVVLFDSSLSMDDEMVARGAHPKRRRDSPLRKRNVAREALSRFVERRKEDRFSLLMFGAAPFRVTPFSQSPEVIQAGIAAAGISNGLPGTDLGRGLIAALSQFEGRAYSGSRVILLVSDGAAEIDDATRQRIRDGMAKHRVALDWLYLRSANWPRLDDEKEPEAVGLITDVAMHRFFKTLPTTYKVFEAESPDAVSKAVAEIERQQNLPLEYRERIPRRDFTHLFYGLAMVAAFALLIHRGLTVRSFQTS